jgi:hypothetical protein
MEEFEYIKGYENLYKINKNGDIYSCIYRKNIVHQTTGDNYKYVHLSKEGKRFKARVHRLLALQYLLNPDNLPEVDHIDRDKNNNTLINLRWVTRIENRHNRPDIIVNLTDEQKEERNIKIREYKRLWAQKNRKEKEPKIKVEKVKPVLTEEEKQTKLEARRKKYAENKLNDKQREYINRPEVKERRRLQQIAKRKNILIEE